MRPLILLALIVILFSCSKQIMEDPVILEPMDSVGLVWKMPLADTIEYVESIYPIVTEGGVLFSNIAFTIEDEPLRYYNKHSGELLWEWNDYSGTFNEAQICEGTKDVVDGIYYFSTGPNVYALNLEEGRLEWSTVGEESGLPWVAVDDEVIYHCQSDDGIEQLHCDLVRKDRSGLGSWDTVFVVGPDVDGYRPIIGEPAFSTNLEGDPIMLFGINWYRYPPLEGQKSEIVSYNLKVDSIDYRHVLSNEKGIFSAAPIILGDKAYSQASLDMVCYSIHTGEMIWSTELGDPLLSNMVMGDSRLYSVADDKLFALNPMTGAIIWEVPAGKTMGKIVYHNDVIYYGAHGDENLHAVDGITGEKLWTLVSPDEEINTSSGFSAGINLDTENGYVFCSNLINALCYKTIR